MNRLLVLALPAYVLVQVFSSSASAAVPNTSTGNCHYVRISGSDANGGTGPTDAWQTIGRAALAVQPGDTVYVGAGTYIESVPITTSGASGAPISFIGDTTGFYTGDAGSVSVDANGATSCFHFDGADYLTLEGFTLMGQYGTGGAVRMTLGTPIGIIVRNNRIHRNMRAILVRNSDSIVLESNVITSSSGPESVDVRDSTNVVVRNNLIYSCNGRAIDFEDSTGLVEGNTAYLNHGDQIFIEGALSVVTVRHNVVTSGMLDGIRTVAPAQATSSYNLSWGNLGLNWSGAGPGTGDQSFDPLYEDPDGADNALAELATEDDRFQLQAGSPAVDAGGVNASAFLFSDGTSAAAYTTRLDEVLDGTAPDGPLLNLGFHYDVLRDCDADGFPDEIEVDANSNGIPDECEAACAPVFYCSGKTTSQGLVPFLTTSGIPSMVAQNATAFRITANNMIPGNIGFLLYGYSKGSLNYHGGILCIKAPVFKSFPSKFADANGMMFRNFNQVLALGNDPLLTVGQVVATQWRGSDPADPAGFGDSLTDGCRFKICP